MLEWKRERLSVKKGEQTFVASNTVQWEVCIQYALAIICLDHVACSAKNILILKLQIKDWQIKLK